MKNLISLFALILSVNAHADHGRVSVKDHLAQLVKATQGLKNSTLSLNNQSPNGSFPPTDPADEILPIRTGKAKFQIQKSQILQQSDGVISIAVTPICTIEVDMPVYDFRNTANGWVGNFPSGECQTTLDGQPAKIVVRADMSLTSRIHFDEGGKTDGKFGHAVLMTFTGPNLDQFGPYDFAFAGTRDMNNTSLMGGINGQPAEVCSNDGNGNISCSTLTGEFISAGFELMDQP